MFLLSIDSLRKELARYEYKLKDIEGQPETYIVRIDAIPVSFSSGRAMACSTLEATTFDSLEDAKLCAKHFKSVAGCTGEAMTYSLSLQLDISEMAYILAVKAAFIPTAQNRQPQNNLCPEISNPNPGELQCKVLKARFPKPDNEIQPFKLPDWNGFVSLSDIQNIPDPVSGNALYSEPL